MAELSYATLGHFILLIYMDSHDLLNRFHDFIFHNARFEVLFFKEAMLFVEVVFIFEVVFTV